MALNGLFTGRTASNFSGLIYVDRMITSKYHTAVFISARLSSPSVDLPRAVDDRGLDIGADMKTSSSDRTNLNT